MGGFRIELLEFGAKLLPESILYQKELGQKVVLVCQMKKNLNYYTCFYLSLPQTDNFVPNYTGFVKTEHFLVGNTTSAFFGNLIFLVMTRRYFLPILHTSVNTYGNKVVTRSL